MKKLLGIYENEKGEWLIVQEGGRVFMEKGNVDDFENVELIRKRNFIIADPLENEKSVTGEGVFDFRYGPVTAGLGEAGVYHLFTYGERILQVKIDTSYKRREIDEKMKGKRVEDGLKMAESICGNFAVSHALAYARAVENAYKIKIPDVAVKLRAVALELERMYNHVYAISRLASAAAQLVLASHLQGLFEEVLILNENLSNSRFLKSFIRIGGVSFMPSADKLDYVQRKVDDISSEFQKLFEHSLLSRNYVDRLHSTAILNADDAQKLGLTGPSLRACNVLEDLRMNEDVYSSLKFVTDEEGDSLSRMEVRAHEFVQSAAFVSKMMNELKKSKTDRISTPFQARDEEGLGFCESPSGSIVYHVEIQDGKLKDVYVSTPSVFGFAAIAHSMRSNIFTDFPFAVESYGVNFADAAR
jgi:Ni,Fe-hydrogenase III large subunit